MSMISPQDRADEVANLMKAKMAIGGTGLATKLRRGGRKLPRHVRREASYLIEAAALCQNPKFLARVDHTKVNRAHTACVKYLETVDPSSRRVDAFMSVLAGVALAVLIPAGLFVTALVLRGYL
jgi:hypothetical protein